MAAKKLTVVISQAQGKNPQKRHLEEELAARLIMEPGIDVCIVPHLNDMTPDHSGLLLLKSVSGPIVVLSWLYPRAARWILDRQGVKGHEGVSLLTSDDEEDEEQQQEESARGIGAGDVPNRRLYCIDLRVESTSEPYLEELRRIGRENTQETVELLSWVGGNPSGGQLQQFLNPAEQPPVPANGSAPDAVQSEAAPHGTAPQLVNLADETPAKRRWYPVIDYSRCTNCMECIDFCLFGVYGVDTMDKILVEAQDNCKKGCPACSRVCPENAIIFPQHKSPAIAGADGEVAGLKIDLSKLFGGSDQDPLQTAVAERDAELLKDGRDAVGMEVGVPKRQAEKPPRKRDELDDLMDGLDDMDF
ncbi:MAG: ATP-binding protein [Maioricimonas sp. JB049]